MTENPEDKRLDSWKLIARYFGKSERTVRRWEAEEGLPVHRHMHKVQGTVYALESELAAWQQSRRSEQSDLGQSSGSGSGSSIVVTPFEFLGDDPSQSYLAVGFTDELIADLSRIDDIRVISRTSSFALADRGLSAGEIRKLLKVDYLVEGSVLLAGGKLKTSIQIVDCRKDQSLWTHAITCGLNDIFDAQAALVQEVAGALKFEAPADAEDNHLPARHTDRHLWEALVRARVEALRWTPAAIRNAISLLDSSISRFGPDPGLVSALGRCHLFLRETGVDMSGEPILVARDCLDRLEISAPDAWETHHLAGWIAYQCGEPRVAIRALQRAHQQHPDDPDTMALLSYCYLLSGLDELAAPLVDRLISIDPLTPLNHSLVACADLFAGRFGEAVAHYRHMVDLDPTNKLAHLFHCMALALAGQADEVQKIVSSEAGASNSSPVDRLLHAFGDAAAGRAVSASPPMDEIIRASTVDMFPRLMAQAHGLAGERKAALEWLTMASDRGYNHYPFITQNDPSFDCLKQDKGFTRLTTTIKDRWLATREEFLTRQNR